MLLAELKAIEDRQQAKLRAIQETVKQQQQQQQQNDVKPKKEKAVQDKKLKLAFGPAARDYRKGFELNQPLSARDLPEKYAEKKPRNPKKRPELAWGGNDDASDAVSISEVSSKKQQPQLHLQKVIPSGADSYFSKDRADVQSEGASKHGGAGYLNRFQVKQAPPKKREKKVNGFEDPDDISALTSVAPSAIASEGNNKKYQQKNSVDRRVAPDYISLPALPHGNRLPSAPIDGRDGQGHGKERTSSAPPRIKTIEDGLNLPDIGVKVSHDYGPPLRSENKLFVKGGAGVNAVASKKKK